MSKNSAVFVPGLSGLSVNHAFAYGRPYITKDLPGHGPEISHLIDGKNGYLLKNTFLKNVEKIVKLLVDYELLSTFCKNAKQTGKLGGYPPPFFPYTAGGDVNTKTNTNTE